MTAAATATDFDARALAQALQTATAQGQAMDARLMLRTLAVRSAWQSRDRWDSESLAHHQDEALTALRRHAYRHSAFYRQLHAGMREAPLAELPVITKADLMANFDQALTDNRLSLVTTQEHLRALTAQDADPGRAWRAPGGGPLALRSAPPGRPPRRGTRVPCAATR